MEGGLELGAVVRLDDLDLERQALDDAVEELDGGGLVHRRVDPRHAQPGAVVDGSELEVLVAASAPPWDIDASGSMNFTRWPGSCFSYRSHRRSWRL
ncbi:hypothetical protein AB0E78_41635 [Streptomyces sp. NPDC032198]|uniref:hypothetical protein n=1 Tax=Streptomyces sp. NPDC032198 TaxID=3155127 RepID=UPI00340A0BB4